jgi:hypothetical protein
MTFMLMNKNMYTMNASEYLFRNMFDKHVEDDDEMVQSFKTALDDSLYNDGDGDKTLTSNEEIIFGNEQLQNLWNTKYDTFEKQPFDSEEEWIVVMNDNGPVDNYANHPEDGDGDDDDDIVDE